MTHINGNIPRRLSAIALAVAVSVTVVPHGDGNVYAAASKKLSSPTNLTVSSKTEKSFTVKWNKGKKLLKGTKYQIKLKTGNGKYKKLATTSKRVYTINGLKDGVKYKVSVRAVKGDRTSAYLYSPAVTLKAKDNPGASEKPGTGETENPGASEKPGTGGTDNSGGSDNSGTTVTPGTGNTGNSGSTENSGSTVTPGTGGSGTPGTAITPETKKVDVIDNEKTKLLDTGYAQYVVVSYADGYTLKNTHVWVDGVDVSEAMTPVTDDGSVAKWEITSLNPAEVKVTTEDGSGSESVTLSENKNPGKPVVQKDTDPAYVIAHGAVSIFDYYLPSYDNDGNVRVNPSKTTFASNDAAVKRIKYYAPDAELKSDGSGNVQIMFNYASESDKAWFDAIPESGAVTLVSYDERKADMGSLKYTKTTNVSHGSNTVATIDIALGQTNFRNNGKYYVRVKSADKHATQGVQSCMALINVVNETAPTIKLSESTAIHSGQNIHFKIDNMIYGVTSPIESVVLTKPDGSSEELTYINDYYLFGNSGLFVLYNDTNAEEGKGVNHTTQKGVYNVEIRAAGFKTISKKFEVVDGESVSTNSSVKRSAAKMDAVSGASSSSGGSSEESSSGSSISANLMFNGDLLSNAIILDKIGYGSSAASAIVDRWAEDVIPDYVVNADGSIFYDWTDYYNAVSDSKIGGKYLSFESYTKSDSAKTVKTRSANVKAVLEDNSLGDINSKYSGSTGSSGTTGSGESEKKDLEDVSLSAGDGEHETNADVTIKVDGSKGDFLKNLSSVLISRDGSDAVTVLTKDAGGSSGNDWYELVGDMGSQTEVVIKGGQFKEAGEYTVTLASKYYDVKTVSFTVKAASEGGSESGIPAAPAVKGIEGSDAYTVSFNGEEADIEKYLSAIESVTVGGTTYSKATLSFFFDGKSYMATNDPTYGGSRIYLKLGKDAFSKSENTTVEVKADGYKTLIFQVTKEGKLYTA